MKYVQLLLFVAYFEVDNILHLEAPFWAIHEDRIMAVDVAASTLVTIQVNLVAGTLATYVRQQESLVPLLRQLLKFEVL